MLDSRGLAILLSSQDREICCGRLGGGVRMDGVLVFGEARRGISLSNSTPYFLFSALFPFCPVYVGIPVSVNVNIASVGELRTALLDLPC